MPASFWTYFTEFVREPVTVIAVSLALTSGIVVVSVMDVLARGEASAVNWVASFFGVANLLLLGTGGAYIVGLATDALREKRRRAVAKSSPSTSSTSHDGKND
jgi:hypothetical protein